MRRVARRTVTTLMRKHKPLDRLILQAASRLPRRLATALISASRHDSGDRLGSHGVYPAVAQHERAKWTAARRRVR